jgi:excisionase family DNA binding protein
VSKSLLATRFIVSTISPGGLSARLGRINAAERGLARRLGRLTAPEPPPSKCGRQGTADMSNSHTRLPRLLTIPEVAEHLRLSTKTVRRLIASRALSARRVGHAWRISENDLRTYLEFASL